MAAEQVTKNERYREAFSALGTDVNYKDFQAHCKKTWGIQPPESTFYALRSQVKKEKAAPTRSTKLKVPTPAVKPPIPTAKSPTCAVSDLPTLLTDTRAILADFGGDKEALIKFIAAL